MAVHPEKFAALAAALADAKPLARAASSAAAGEQMRNSAVGKVVGDALQKRLDALEEEDPDLCCPVTLGLFVDPVTLPDGFTYERESAKGLTQPDGTFVSPMTRQAVPATLVDAPHKKQAARAFREARARELVAFAAEAFAARADRPHMACKALERVAEYLQALGLDAGGAPLELRELVGEQCAALISAARTADNADGTWTPKPAALRALHALALQTAGAGDDKSRKVTCCVCFDDYRAADGIECCPPAAPGAAAAARHFLCDECLGGHVKACIDAEGLRLFAERGGVRCGDPTCAAPPYSDKALAECLAEGEFGAYSAAKEKLAETRIAAQLEAEFAERMRKEVDALRAAANNVAEQLRLHVLEKIITLACPRCGQVFVDFNGCCALTCSRAGCGAAFCAYCLEDCGGDAHAHVGRCHRFGAKGDMFGDFGGVQRRRRAGLFKAFLRHLPPAVAAQLVADCARDIADLDMGGAAAFDGVCGGDADSPRAAMAISIDQLRNEAEPAHARNARRR